MSTLSSTVAAALRLGSVVAAASVPLLYLAVKHFTGWRPGIGKQADEAKSGMPEKVNKAGNLFWDLLRHPLEAAALARYACSEDARIPEGTTQEVAFCYESLTKVSRSFSAVILRLPEELRLSVTVFYLSARALDSMEDDTSIPHDLKVREMKAFPGRLKQAGWKCTEDFGSGLKLAWRDTSCHEVELLHNFDKVIEVYGGLKESYREAIMKQLVTMSDGMISFLTKPVESIEDYDNYCYYVAGVVGLGLSTLFGASGLENPEYFGAERSNEGAIAMGRFLQKTNIIRDYHEDITQKNGSRMFYPKAVWSKYATNLEDFLRPENQSNALNCLNELVANAITHIPACLSYMEKLKQPRVFQFCAIPQIMAIATLERVFDNPAVFSGMVKIRKAEAAFLIYQARSFEGVLSAFEYYLSCIAARNPSSGASHDVLESALYRAHIAVEQGKLAKLANE